MSQNRDEQHDEQRANEQGRSDTPDQQRDDGVDSATEWFASTAVRAGLTIVGAVLLLFALGQAVGLPLLDLVASALTSQTGQWLVVAFFAILLIGAAQKGMPTN